MIIEFLPKRNLCQFWGCISYFSEVVYRWLHVYLLYYAIRSFVAEELIYTAVFVVHISKNDGIGGAALHTGGFYFAVYDASVVAFCFEFASLYALYAKSTFFHYAPCPYGYIGV